MESEIALSVAFYHKVRLEYRAACWCARREYELSELEWAAYRSRT